MKIKPNSKRGGVRVELGRFEERLIDVTPAPFRLKNILVPVDFSDDSLGALQYAAPLAAQFGAKLYLVHVVDTTGLVNELPDATMTNIGRARASVAQDKLAGLAAEEIDRKIPLKIEVTEGKPFMEITRLARLLDVDLIVIATHGHTGLKHIMLGSTAERVVRHAPCPVLVVRGKESEKYEHDSRKEKRPWKIAN